jgi:hypothetical protein
MQVERFVSSPDLARGVGAVAYGLEFSPELIGVVSASDSGTLGQDTCIDIVNEKASLLLVDGAIPIDPRERPFRSARVARFGCLAQQPVRRRQIAELPLGAAVVT